MEEDDANEAYEDEIFEDLDIDEENIPDLPRQYTAEVTNISFSMSRNSVGDFFSDLGCNIASLDYSIVEHGKRNKTAVAIIEFEDQQSLDVCLSANGFELFGRHIKTSVWQPPLPPSEQPSMEIAGIPEETPAVQLPINEIVPEIEPVEEAVPKVLARRNRNKNAEEESITASVNIKPKPATEVIPLSAPIHNHAPFGGNIPTASAPARREKEREQPIEEDKRITRIHETGENSGTSRHEGNSVPIVPAVPTTQEIVSNRPVDIVDPAPASRPVAIPTLTSAASFAGRPSLAVETKTMNHSHSEGSLLSARSTHSNTSSTNGGSPRSLITVERSREFLALMMKNVSRDDPLTDAEIEALKEFRALLSHEQWHFWLRFARHERKKLKQALQSSSQINSPGAKSVDSALSDLDANSPVHHQKQPNQYTATLSSSGFDSPARKDRPTAIPVGRHDHGLSPSGSRRFEESALNLDHHQNGSVAPLGPGTKNHVPKPVAAPVVIPRAQSPETVNDGVSLSLNRPSARRGSRPLPASSPAVSNLKNPQAESPAPTPRPAPSPAVPSSAAAAVATVWGSTAASASERKSVPGSNRTNNNNNSSSSSSSSTTAPPKTAPAAPVRCESPVLETPFEDADSRKIEAAYHAADQLMRSFEADKAKLSRRKYQSDPNTAVDLDTTMGVLKDMMVAMQSSKAVLNKLSNAELITPVISSAASDTGEEYPPSSHPAPFALRSNSTPANYHDTEVCDDINDWLFHRSELASSFTVNREDFLSHPSTRYQHPSGFQSSFPTFGQSFSVASVAAGTSRDGPTASLRYRSDASGAVGPGGSLSREDLQLSSSQSAQAVAPSRVIRLGLDDAERVFRVCLAQGPLIKSFEEYPIRVDVESSAVDVVWREIRSNPGDLEHLKHKPVHTLTDRSTNVLRRERFVFDDVLAGVSATDRLIGHAKLRVRRAIACGSNLTFLTVACGEESGFDIEPPVATLIGTGSGGSGVVHCVIDEVLNCIRPAHAAQAQHRINPNSPFMAIKIAHEMATARLTLSVVLLHEGQVEDLLSRNGGGFAELSAEQANPQSGVNNFRNSASFVKRKNDRSVLSGVTRIKIESSNDFDRIAGMLMGKRAASSEMLNALMRTKHSGSASQSHAVNTSGEGHVQQQQWRHLGSTGAPDNTRSNLTGGNSTTMLIWLNASGGGVSKSRNNVDFYFACPCGPNWSTPGSDVNMVAELISSLPHPPPPSVIRASPLTRILAESSVPCDFVNIMSVNRHSAINATDHRQGTSNDVAAKALNSFRIIT